MEIGEIREETEQMETEKEKDGDFKIPGKKKEPLGIDALAHQWLRHLLYPFPQLEGNQTGPGQGALSCPILAQENRGFDPVVTPEQSATGDLLAARPIEPVALGLAPEWVKEREAEGKGVEERRPATRWSVLAASSVAEESSESESEREGGLTDSSLAAESSASQSGSGPAGGYELETVGEFLQKTKGKKNVVVEEYFPNISLFKATDVWEDEDSSKWSDATGRSHPLTGAFPPRTEIGTSSFDRRTAGVFSPADRSLEDHEHVVHVQSTMASESKFVFRKNYAKYEFFKNPANFFPEQIVAWCQETNGTIPPSQLLQV
ncbi:UNVERIFIED_CONTAM: hypothetical protein FKN15_019692 [Acipenser sinensis]